MKNYWRALPIDIEEEIAKNWIQEGIAQKEQQEKYSSFQQLTATHQNLSSSWTCRFGDEFSKNTYLPFANIEETVFVGYRQLTTTNAKLLMLLNSKFEMTNNIANAKYFVTDKTPFYATRGGQRHDTGFAVFNNNSQISKLRIINVINMKNVTLHQFEPFLIDYKKQNNIKFAEISNTKTNVELIVDKLARRSLARNHSATHLLHQTVKRLFGQYIMQKGSAIYPQYFRFDFNCLLPIKEISQSKINQMVNQQISAKLEATTTITSLSSIKNNSKIEKHFQENYPSKVRIIKLGSFSHEVCSGTHVANTSEIEAFLVTKILSIGKQIIRIHAITSWKTIYEYYRDKVNEYNDEYTSMYQFNIKSKDKFDKIDSLSLMQFKKQFKHFMNAEFITNINILTGKLIKQKNKELKQQKKKIIDWTISDMISELSKNVYPWLPNKYIYYLCLNQYHAKAKLNIISVLKQIKKYENLFHKNTILLFYKCPCYSEAGKLSIYTEIFNRNNSNQIIHAKNELIKITEKFGNGKGGGSATLAHGVIKIANITIMNILNSFQVEKR